MLYTIFNYKLHLSLDRDEVQTPTRHPKLRPHQECEAEPLVPCGESARIVSER